MGALTKKKKKSNNNNNKKRKRERKWKRERIDRFFSSQWRSRSVTRISLNGMESRETCLARRRFRIILRSVQPNSRVLEMPEIRYSKRFEYLRVSRRVILPPSLRKYSVYDCQGKRERERVRIMARVANNRPFLWSLADSELNILKYFRPTSYRFKEIIISHLK